MALLGSEGAGSTGICLQWAYLHSLFQVQSGCCDVARIVPRRLCDPSRGHFHLRAVAILGLSSGDIANQQMQNSLDSARGLNATVLLSRLLTAEDVKMGFEGPGFVTHTTSCTMLG